MEKLYFNEDLLAVSQMSYSLVVILELNGVLEI